MCNAGFFFHNKCFDVAKLAIIHKKTLAKFGLQIRYESIKKSKNTFIYILTTSNNML